MRVLVLETNLIWSSRLKKSIEALGHDCVVAAAIPSDGEFEVAILNLGDSVQTLASNAATLKSGGTYLIGHAGHREGDLLKLGQELCCDELATNSSITFKLDALLSQAKLREKKLGTSSGKQS